MVKAINNINTFIEKFVAGSGNFELYPELTYEGICLFIPQLQQLLLSMNIFDDKVYNISEFYNNNCEELGNIMKRYGSDKSTKHNYNIIYYHIFNMLGISNIKDVLEIGIGTNNPKLVSTMGSSGKPGASLKAFKTFLPKATIYGCDIDKNILFNEDRIKTCYVDQLKFETFNEIEKHLECKEFDIIIDDGLHSIGANFNTLLFAMDHLKPNGCFIIEDIMPNTLDVWQIISSIINIKMYEFNSMIIKSKIAYMLFVQKKNI